MNTPSPNTPVKKKSTRVSRVWVYLFIVSLLLNTLFLFGFQKAKNNADSIVDIMISKPITLVLLMNLDGMHEWNRYRAIVEQTRMSEPFVHEAEHLLGAQQMLAAPIFQREKFIQYYHEQLEEHQQIHKGSINSLANFWEQLPYEKRIQFLRHHNKDGSPANRKAFEDYIYKMRDDAIERTIRLQLEYEQTNPKTAGTSQ